MVKKMELEQFLNNYIFFFCYLFYYLFFFSILYSIILKLGKLLFYKFWFKLKKNYVFIYII
jgi:hypothetical protein